MRRLAILVAYGPETRAFVQSGLAERLAERYELTFAATQPDSPALRGLPGELSAAPEAVEPAALTRLRRLRARIHPASLAGLAARASESFAVRLWGGSREWRRWFERQRVDLVLTASYSSARTLPALAAATRLGLPCVVLTNSWKDVHHKPHCGSALAGLGVFAEPERRRFLEANPSFAAFNVRSIGSLHCAALLRAQDLSRQELAEALRLDPRRPFISYVAARDGEGERNVIDKLLDLLEKLEGRPQLVVRLNPMDEAGWTSSYSDRDELVFDRPSWTWDPEREWICPLPADAPRWAALLRHAAAIVSRPSTAAWEAAALGRRTLTVAWGTSRQAWDDAGFEEARSRGWVRGILTDDALETALRLELKSPVKPAATSWTNAVERASAVIETALAPAGPRPLSSAQTVREALR